MNIVYVSREFGPVLRRGIGTYIENACVAFAQAGHGVFLVTDCMNSSHRNLMPKGVELVETCESLPHQKDCFFTRQQEYSYRVLNTLRTLAKRHRLDVIEFPDYCAEGFATIRAKRLLNEFPDTRLIVKCHTPLSLLFSINESRNLAWQEVCDFELEDYCVRHADLVTSPSAALASYYRDRIGRTDIRLCPYPMHLPELPSARKFTARSVQTVRFIGSVEVRKGVDVFIEAALQILRANPAFRFEIYGKNTTETSFGKNYARLLAARIPEPFRDRIIFEGTIPYDALPALLSDSCLCVFPSRWENWANVCLEAMSMGCVAIASNRGGMAEMIEHGTNGFLVDPLDPAGIARLVLQHHQDLPRLEQISRAAHARSRELADPAKAQARMLENYTTPVASRCWLTPAARKVSVIIPFYNQGQYLEEAIQSVRNSTHSNLEVIVVNDGCSDPMSNEAFEKIEGVVKVRKENGGLSSARNAGIRAATGDYILMLDADDKIHPEYIARAVAALDNNPGLAYLSCHAQNFGIYTHPYLPVGFVPALMSFLNTDGKCANVYRREVFARCGGYDEEMVSYEDWDFLLTIYEQGLEGDVLPDEFFLYRRHYDSMVFQVADPLRAELIQYMMVKHQKFLAKHSPLMALVLAGLWKKEEIRAEKAQSQAVQSGNGPGQPNNREWHANEIWAGDVPVKTRDVKFVLRKYFTRKLRRLFPASVRGNGK
jgi:glycosyltransferase involved in cell wall biosynthesis